MSTPTVSWRQRNVALTRADGSALPSATALFETLDPLLSNARAARQLELFFFQRKPPDVRLRLGGRDGSGLDTVMAAIDRALDDLHAGGVVASWAASVYEPEVRKFGGPGASQAVHLHFDHDTALWLAWQRLETNAAHEALGPEPSVTIAATLANELFVQVLCDRDEVWDTWCNLADVVGLDAAAPAAIAGDGTLATLAASVEGPASAAFAECADGLDSVARALRTEHDCGSLTVGMRAMLPFVVQMDMQRWGVDGTVQAAVAVAMMAAWDPHPDLRGR